MLYSFLLQLDDDNDGGGDSDDDCSDGNMMMMMMLLSSFITQLEYWMSMNLHINLQVTEF